jgi:hypothetical protein
LVLFQKRWNLLGGVSVVTDQVRGAAEVARDLARSGSGLEPVGNARDTRDTVDGDAVQDKARNVGSGHGSTADAVGGAVAGVPSRENTSTGGKDVENSAVVGVRGDGPGAVDGTDGDGTGSRSRGGVGGISAVVASSNGRDDTGAGSRLDGVVERSRVATTKGHADNRLGGSALGDDIVGSPVETTKDNRSARRAALENLNSLDGSLLGNTVGLSGNSASNVSTVTNTVGVVAAVGSIDSLGSALELVVSSPNTSVNDVGKGSGTSSSIVDVAGRSARTVRYRAESPRSTGLGGQGTLGKRLLLGFLDKVESPNTILLNNSNLKGMSAFCE